MKRLIHAITDLALAFCFGGGIVAAISATVIFRDSAARGYERAHANVLAGEMFAKVGGPLLIAAIIAGVCGLVGAYEPPTTALPSRMKLNLWRAMAVLGLLITMSVGYMELVNNPPMHKMRREGTWQDGKLVDSANQEQFDTWHHRATAIYSFMILASGALLVSRRVFG